MKSSEEMIVKIWDKLERQIKQGQEIEFYQDLLIKILSRKKNV